MIFSDSLASFASPPAVGSRAPGRTLALLCSATLASACTPSSPSTMESSESATEGGTTTGTPPDASTSGAGSTSSPGSSDDGPDTSGSSTSGGDATDTGELPADSSSGEPEPTDCTAPQPLPDPPVDCSGVDGIIDTSVIIEDGGDDPSILEGVRRIEGSLRINRLDSSNLDFMACLEEVTGDVTIFGNDQLTDVSGLHGLTTLGTDFIFSDNPATIDFDGLPNLAVVPRHLIIQDNDGLQSISGFHSLTEVGGNMLIQNNDALLDMDGLGGLEVMGGVFAVTANPQLCISSVNCVGVGITDPPKPPPEWSTQANDESC